MKVSDSTSSKHYTHTYVSTYIKNQGFSRQHATYVFYLSSHKRNTVVYKKKHKLGHQELWVIALTKPWSCSAALGKSAPPVIN